MKNKSISNVLIVGPDSKKNGIGGVLNHMVILKQLDTLQEATFWDPGSINNYNVFSVLKIIKRCLQIRTLIDKKDFNHIWINASIYPFSLLKVLIIIAGLRNYKKIKVRIFFHGGRFQSVGYLKSSIMAFFFKKMLSKVFSNHFLSAEQGEGFSQIFPSLKWTLFSNYLPFNNCLEKEVMSKSILLFVGRIVKEKGIFDILKAYERIKIEFTVQNLQLWYVGDGPDFCELKNRLDRRNLDSVKLWGRLDQDELAGLYSKASMLLLPSYHQEGFPYVVIEAMRAALPIIATSSGVLASLLSDGRHGMLVPQKDPELLSEAIVSILSDEKKANRIAQENALYFKNRLSLSAAESYYQSLLSQ